MSGLLYNIRGLCPQRSGRGAGFCIQLFPAWKEEIENLNLTQERVNNLVETVGRTWLDGCGFNQIYDPDEDPRDRWEREKLHKPRKPSPSARPLYQPNHDLRVDWGPWGPEHISVPGDACGLDLVTREHSLTGIATLSPHNVDNLSQAHLLLVVFTYFADCVVTEIADREIYVSGLSR